MATYTIPPGLTFKQKKAMAALLACAPCCGVGSGSGSGSGSGDGSGSGSGSGGGTYCCECARFSVENGANFPATLDVTITNSVMGTRTLTVSRAEGSECYGPIKYTGSYASGVGSSPDDYDSCTGFAVGPGILQDDDLLTVTIWCQLCGPPTVYSGTQTTWHIYYFWTKVIGTSYYNVSGGTVLGVVTCDPFSLTKTQEVYCTTDGTDFGPYYCCHNGTLFDDIPDSSQTISPGGFDASLWCYPAQSDVLALDGTSVQLDVVE